MLHIVDGETTKNIQNDCKRFEAECTIGLKYTHFLNTIGSPYSEPPRGVGGVSSEVKYLRDFWTNFVDLRISVHKGFVSTNRRRRRKNTGFRAKQSRFASTNRLWSAEKSLPSTAPLARHHHDLMLDSLQ